MFAGISNFIKPPEWKAFLACSGHISIDFSSAHAHKREPEFYNSLGE